MRRIVLALLVAAGCAHGAGNEQQLPAEKPAPASAEAESVQSRIDASINEVRTARAAAEDALQALSAYGTHETEELRLRVPATANRDDLATQLEHHAKAHQLEISQLQLLPITEARLDFPAAVHPATPYPVQPKDTLVAVPFRFALTPTKPERIEAFLQSLPDSTRTLIEIRDVKPGADHVDVEANSWMLRAIDPVPRFRFETPSLDKEIRESGDGEISAESRADLEESQKQLEGEVTQTNEILSKLSDERLRTARLDAYLDARERARASGATDWLH